jgi:predicted secreted protein
MQCDAAGSFASQIIGQNVRLEKRMKAMGWLTWAAIYFTVWWTMLFVVLPFGLHEKNAAELAQTPAGQDRGAPRNPLLLKKFLWTSVLSAVLVLIGWLAFASGALDWKAIVHR